MVTQNFFVYLYLKNQEAVLEDSCNDSFKLWIEEQHTEC